MQRENRSISVPLTLETRGEHIELECNGLPSRCENAPKFISVRIHSLKNPAAPESKRAAVAHTGANVR
ncbi:hypothetical protein CesoFtcFv8_006933 [Champsocephalus esox]|uniref:Uncharacterized protein n=1 Tax=Champsocephalus esox TaxID=159716 RepID=A0AAN8CG90_9TELE|nr:hypothetical protein CesoFtcFv8_006933 [Champsocephalus esox]